MNESNVSANRFEEYLKGCVLPTYGKIAVAIDVSLRSASALRRAIALSKVFCAKLYIIHVIPTKLPYAMTSKIAIPYEIYEIQLDHAEKMMDSARMLAKLEGVEVEKVILHGDPAEEILKFVEENKIDLIVVGRKDKEGTLKHLGSVSNKIAIEAKSSVLIEK